MIQVNLLLVMVGKTADSFVTLDLMRFRRLTHSGSRHPVL
jgi:hypothetical protein